MSSTTDEKIPLAVLGAGPAGYAGAFLAADLGVETLLVDPEPNPGGVCLYRGCIPSKALLHVAHLIGQAREARQWGVTFGEASVDLERLRGWKQAVVDKLTGGMGTLSRHRKIRTLQGRARFLDPGRIEIVAPGGETHVLSFDHALVATGSTPVRPPSLFPESRSGRVMDSTAALELETIPESLLVVGGGYIGLELGSVYAALGSRVTVVEMTAGLLPGVDRDLVKPLERRLQGLFHEVLLRTTVSAVQEEDSGLRVALEGQDTPARTERFERMLVSVGRRPNTEALGLENTRVRVDGNGFVIVDEKLRTEEPAIYAVGDVAGQPMLAHKASHEARTAVEVIAGRNVRFDPRAIPAVVFTDPEIAWCGVTEEQAAREGRRVRIARFPWAASGRAVTLGRTEGLTKLVMEPQSGRILGMGIVGAGAGELIAEGLLAVEMGACAEDLSLVIHPHPTLSETVMEAAEIFLGTSTHVMRSR